MTRWTILTIVFAVVACGEGERDRVSSGASDAAAGADSALRTDPNTSETAAATGAATEADTGADTEGTMAADTATATRGTRAGAGAGRPSGPTGAEAMGGTRAPTTRLDLSADQIRRLQTALNDAGCNAGTVDGVLGARTRQAITCGLEKNNLGSDDVNGLYRALDLDF
jgi:peptidoglycan hydrolase-like protein with peptidoglycan-binding domain